MVTMAMAVAWWCGAPTKSALQGSQSAVPATKSARQGSACDTICTLRFTKCRTCRESAPPGSQSAAPATKSALPGSQSIKHHKTTFMYVCHRIVDFGPPKHKFSLAPVTKTCHKKLSPSPSKSPKMCTAPQRERSLEEHPLAATRFCEPAQSKCASIVSIV